VIEFSICVSPRFDCGSQCSIFLLFSDGHQWQCGKVFPQWHDTKWHRLTYRYGQYEQFPSSVTVSLAGSDTQFWAGYYGIKFAQARLHLLLRTNENETNAESEMVIEPKAEHESIDHSQLSPIPDNLPIDRRPSLEPQRAMVTEPKAEDELTDDSQHSRVSDNSSIDEGSESAIQRYYWNKDDDDDDEQSFKPQNVSGTF
jgi:hypothetical protein